MEEVSAGRAGGRPARQRVFALITIAVPILVFVLAELSLSVTHYGGDLRLFTIRHSRGRAMYVSNTLVTRRYFTQPGLVIPAPADNSFPVRKSPNTRRIFFLGESTMAGFPYEYNATAPSFLGEQLRVVLPAYNFEIINVGISAVGSYVVDDLIGELTAYEPDLFVVYVGHNEFYGAYGVGSALTKGSTPWLTRLSIRLQKFRVYLVLRDLVMGIRQVLGGAQEAGDATLMERSAERELIPLGSESYKTCLDAYRRNLRSIIAQSRSAGVPIMFSTCVSNLKDQPPFRSSFPDDMSAERHSTWDRFVAEGDTLMAKGDPEEALGAYARARALALEAALSTYKEAQARFALGEIAKARTGFELARDQDGLRFKATGEFQDTLISVCRAFGAPVARADSAFAAGSEHGIVGNELILEHLHPNIRGYLLMARNWCEALYREGLLAPRAEWRWERAPSDNAVMESAGVSVFDRVVGDMKVAALTRRWPFVEHDLPPVYAATTDVESLLVTYVQRGLPWSEARYALAEHYTTRGRYDEAKREYLAVAHALPYSFQPLLKCVDVLIRQGNVAEAREMCLRAIAVDDNPYARMKLGVILLNGGQPREASREFEEGFRLASEQEILLPPESAASGRYMLAVSYAATGRFRDARREANEALTIRPGYKEPSELLKHLPSH